MRKIASVYNPVVCRDGTEPIEMRRLRVARNIEIQLFKFRLVSFLYQSNLIRQLYVIS